MTQQKVVNFKIGNKEFQFTIAAEQEIADKTLNIIEEVNRFVEQKRSKMFGTENFAYMIFILASNLARANQKKIEESDATSAEKITNEQELKTEIMEMMQKVSFLSDSLQEEKKI
jgi:hypothetical protein